MTGFKFKVQRLFHFYCCKKSKTMQFGDFMVYSLRETENTVKDKFQQEIAQLLWRVKGQIVNKVSFNVIMAVPNNSDPLGQRSTISWKCYIVLHTRKTWKLHLQSLLKKNIRWQQPRRIY
jgi:hypothetical protein